MKNVIARISLFSSEDGGRTQPLPLMNFGCPVFFQNIPALSDQGYDCRLLVPAYGKPIAPGESVDGISMVFLSADKVLPHLKPGVLFRLWEGKDIGIGEILQVDALDPNGSIRAT